MSRTSLDDYKEDSTDIPYEPPPQIRKRSEPVKFLTSLSDLRDPERPNFSTGFRHCRSVESLASIGLHRPSIMSETSTDFPRELCLSKCYKIPRYVIRRAMQTLDEVLSPSSPGSLRPAQIMVELVRFDEFFEVHRSQDQREAIIMALRSSSTDTARVCWADDILFNAFSVNLNLQEMIYFTLDVSDRSTTMSRLVSVGMVITIIASISFWMVDTMPEVTTVQCTDCLPQSPGWMVAFDYTCVAIFTLEYLVRLFVVTSVRFELLRPHFLTKLLSSEDSANLPPKTHGVRKLLQFVCSPSALCDLLTVLPYWIEIAFRTSSLSFPVLRLIRLLRVFRIFKLSKLFNSDLGRLSDAQKILQRVLKRTLPAAAMTLALIALALIVFSSLMYTMERGDWYPQEQVEILAKQAGYSGPRDQGYFIRVRRDGVHEVSPFSSIPEAMWWTLATITTVGFGDAYPITPLGKVVGCFAILYGTILLGLPIGIIGSQFSAEFDIMVSGARTRNEIAKRRIRERMHPNPGCRPDSAAFARAEQPQPGESLMFTAPFPTRLSQILYYIKDTAGKMRAPSRDVTKEAEEMQPVMTPEEEALANARARFEDVMQVHGETCGISSSLQQSWVDTLAGADFSGQLFDWVGIRVLTMLSEAELARPFSAPTVLKLRQAWLEFCVVACTVFEIREDRSEYSDQNESLPLDPFIPGADTARKVNYEI